MCGIIIPLRKARVRDPGEIELYSSRTHLSQLYKNDFRQSYLTFYFLNILIARTERGLRQAKNIKINFVPRPIFRVNDVWEDW